MNVLLVSPIQAVTPHLETELEIVQKHLDNSDKVYLMSCMGQLPGCDFNISADLKKCAGCRKKRENGLALLSDQIQSYPISPIIKFPYASSLPDKLNTIDDLKKWKPHNADLGWGVLSSLISAVQNPVPSLKQNKWLIKRLASSSEEVYLSVKSFLSQGKIDKVYIFNGRLSSCRAVVRACEATGTQFTIHERGGDQERYALYPNTLPHNIQFNSNEIKRFWKEGQNQIEKKRKGAQWFIDRKNKIGKDWFSYTKSQLENKMPDGWDEKKYNVAIFTSSDDEFLSISDDWQNPVYKNQLEGIQQISIDLPKLLTNVHITIRMHPNQARLNDRFTNGIRNIKSPYISVIFPEDNIDTYSLIKKANVVATFGSTVGIEAVYWGTPSILLGRAYYENLEASYKIKSHHDALQAIIAPKKGNREMALAYGYWSSVRGIPYIYYKANGFFNGMFKGVEIQNKIKDQHLKRLYWSINKRFRKIIETLLSF